MIRLTRIVRKQSGPVVLHFNTGDRLEAPAQVVNRIDVSEDETYSLRRLEQKIQETSRSLLPKLARDHLARYPKTSSEFVSHFRHKGYPGSLVKTILDELRREGFIDDEEVARQHIVRRIERKYYGRHKLLAELRERGVPRQVIEELLRDHYPPAKEKERAQQYARKNQEIETSKLASRLENRGFPSSVISTVLETVN